MSCKNILMDNSAKIDAGQSLLSDKDLFDE